MENFNRIGYWCGGTLNVENNCFSISWISEKRNPVVCPTKWLIFYLSISFVRIKLNLQASLK